jgi:ribosomal protein L11 methylase PrmA
LAVSDRIPLIIDPGPSFGAGDHPTTIMALELLEEAISEESQTGSSPTLLDVGTGTGVLAIAGKSLGTGFTVGLDIDSASVFTARRNVDLNGLALSGRSSVTRSALVSRPETWKETSPGTEARATEDTDQAHPTSWDGRPCPSSSWDGRPCPSSSGAGTLCPPSGEGPSPGIVPAKV